MEKIGEDMERSMQIPVWDGDGQMPEEGRPAAGWCIECKEFEEDDFDIHGWCRRRKQMSSDHDSCGLFARRSKNKE